MEIKIQNILRRLNNRGDLLVLFREILGFKSPTISTIPFGVGKENIKRAEIIAELGSVKIFYINLLLSFDETFQSERDIRKIERLVLTKIPIGVRRQNLFIFSDDAMKYWDFVYPAEYGPRLVLKRFTIRPDNRDKLRTPSIQFTNLVVKLEDEDKIYKKLEETFSIEAVSERFFEDYEEAFDSVKKALLKQSSEYERVHRFVHQLLNRLMFLYFVQRRGVFNGDKNFLATFWNTYRNNFEGKDKFYDKWLKVLFFEALNNEFRVSRDYFKISEKIDFNSVLRFAPYLNGGLFREDPEIDYLDIKLTDDFFVKIFDFLESYNFTARENTPLDEDLEIDPEMLGNIYEAMVNVTEITSKDERHKAGIFYTPRTEIEFMLRRSIVEFLFNKTKIDKLQLYQFVFPEIDEQKIPKFTREDAEKLYNTLDTVTIVDPACGSGHYLVIAVQILFDLKKEIWFQLGNSEESFKVFEEKLKIVENSIFGVDIKKWAVEIAKLRLWLDLMVGTEDEQLQPGGEALLPNLSFKIRVGDSLVQEIGGIFFRAKEIKGIPRSLIALKNQLIDTKKAYFHGEKGITEPIVKSKEIQFFGALLDEKINELRGEIHQLEAPLHEAFKKQLQLIAHGKKDTKQLKLELSQKEKERVNFLREQIAHLQEEKQKLSMRSEFAFWPIEFAEVLTGRNSEGGFDIVIANPPYVRQELISDPSRPENKIAAKKYKENLLKQIRLDWNDEDGSLIKISQRADLYVYFYLKGLQLLNPDGVMCYISSNSWLDVGFGAGLQEVLLRRVLILAIYDNQAKRSFKHADVNTIIVLLKAPELKDWESAVKSNKVKFTMFKKPFEEVTFTEILWKIESAGEERKITEEFRLVQKNQWDLYVEGLKEEEEQKRLTKELGAYVGNKWGGKYLRAPDIFYTMLEKGKGKLLRLGDIAKVRFGIKTGANEFFYLDEEAQKKWNIEKEFLKPIIKGPRECSSITINPEQLKFKIFLCHKSKSELKNTAALKYIEYGEKNKIDKTPSVQGRNRWYDIQEPEISDYLWIMTYRERFFVLVNGVVLADARFYDIYSKVKDKIKLGLVLNSTLALFYTELMSRTYGGGGGPVDVKVYEVENMIVLDSNLIADKLKSSKILRREVNTIFTECGFDETRSIREQNPKPLPDRAELDEIIFDELRLTKEERKEVYWAVAELVQNRLKKAKSL